MTLDEAKKIARCAAWADSGCSGCVEAMCKDLNEAALGFTFTFLEDRYDLKTEDRVTVEPTT